MQIPPPLGTPDGGAKPPQPRPPAQKPAITPPPVPASETTAPRTVPEDVPQLEPATSNATSTAIGTSGDPGSSNGSAAGPAGVPGGAEGSLGSVDAPVVPLPETIYQPHEVQAPVLTHRVDPRYPDVLRPTRKSATIIVRCIIDRNGRVRDPQVIVPSLPPFNAAVLEAVQQWRYEPGELNGVAVQTYLNVTVHFAIN